MRIETNVWRLIGAIGLILGIMAAPAAARDRPGTPMNLQLHDCGPANGHPTFCGLFSNTASEDVRIEWQITRNGQPATDAFILTCPDPRNQAFPASECITRVMSGSQDVTFWMRSLDFDSRYCVQLRARRQSDQVVSELWSAPVCYTTPPAPPPPPTPAVKIQFDGNRSPPGLLVAIPPKDAYATASVQFGDGPTYSDLQAGRWIYDVRPGDTAVPVKVCVTNLAGQACGSTVYHLGPPPKPVRTTGRAPGSADLPFSGDWTVTASYGRFDLYMIQFPNNSMRGEVNHGAPDVVGNPTGPTSAHLSFNAPRKGQVDITLSPDGNHFYGGGQLDDQTTFTWAATRNMPSSPN